MTTQNYSRIFLVLLLALISNQVHSQLSKTHYIPPLTSAEIGNANPESQYIYLSTPNANDISYTIKPVGQPVSNYITGVVSNTNPKEIYIGSGNGQLFVASSQTSIVTNNKGYIIEAEDVIYASVRMNAGSAAQAGALVSKGLSALGTTFRVGSYTNENPQTNYLNFVSVMATEDNTQVTFSNLPTGLNIKNYTGSTPVSITLNEGGSYIVATNSSENIINHDGLIGTLVQSDKPIVVNCGSANGSFHNGSGRDYGIDQIVDLSKVGSEYIFVKGNGTNDWENILLVAHTDNTTISINGVATGIIINAGAYHLIEGNKYNTAGNMYVETSNPVFAYQGVGATSSEANQGMFFVPPLSCETRGNLDNIAHIGDIGNTSYTGGISIVTKIGATVTINNAPVSNYTTSGPNNVTGNADYVTYKVTGLSGNISVQSTDELYCAYFNYNGAATSGSFYSGFPTAPEINFDAAFITLGICIPNITLSVANMGNFDSIEWWFDDGTGFVSTGASTVDYTPTISGTYKLIGTLDCSNLTLESLEVPVSICPKDIDNDGIIDNIDIDNDNDGIQNCIESYGDQDINLTNITSGSLSVGSFSYTGTVTTLGNVATTPFVGAADGTFMSELPSKFGTTDTSVNYQLSFDHHLNLKFEYATSTALGNSLLTDDEEFIIQVPNTKTITLLDPDDQLLVDTNYDGIYETGVTQFSSFEIRFKLNGTSLAFGNGTFSFLANLVDSFTYIHKNNSDTTSNQTTFKISATCVPKDTDLDGVEDALDFDSDNDGIPDIIENIGVTMLLSTIDADTNGLDDIFDINALPLDSDTDGVYDFYDLDSDNDGVYDLEESGGLGSFLSDTDLNGIIDWFSPTDLNGLVDSAETSPDSGILAFTILDTDADLVFNYIDSDSDGDLCADVIEAGFSDLDENNQLGDVIAVVDGKGVVINSSDGYTPPHINYITAAPISIITQPLNTITCDLSNTEITIETSAIDNIQWQLSSDGINWIDIIDNSLYTNATSMSLLILNVPLTINSTKYRARLDKTGNTCGLYSNEVILTVNPLPTITTPVSLKQCDNDTDGFSAFNLTEVNSKISTNAANETFTYFKSFIGADTNDSNEKILDPITYSNQTVTTDTVWARVETINGCYRVSEINLTVSTTGIPDTFQREFFKCDDFIDETNNDRDGVSSFDFSSVTAEIENILSASGQQLTIVYYRNETDALAEINPITDPSNYRNIGYPNSQQIYIRVDSQLDNDCLGFGAHVTLNVEALPIANSVTYNRQCADFPFDAEITAEFDTFALESDLLLGQSDITISYFNANGDSLTDINGNTINSPFPATFRTTTQTITARVTNNSTNDPNGSCFDETTIDFIVDVAPIAYPVTIAPVCDDDANDTDGFYDFDTSTIQTTLLENQTGMEVHYFDAAGLELPSPLPDPFTSATQTLLAQVINPINTTCIATITFDLIVNPLPAFTLDSPQIICITEPVSTISLTTYQDDPLEILDYEWTNQAGTLLSTAAILDVTEPGNYFVTLTKKNGTNCSRTKEFIVNESEVATITQNDILIEDDSENNTITINNNNLGAGDYEFSLDDDFYSYQDEPFFDYVQPGIHTIYIRDKNNCGIAQIDVSVIGYPKFFTPNNDGFNDTWKVLGIDENFYTNSTIFIFNRFGKLIIQIDSKSDGWDGTLNGNYLPSTDYWFAAEIIDTNGILKIRKGHFSLIRR